MVGLVIVIGLLAFFFMLGKSGDNKTTSEKQLLDTSLPIYTQAIGNERGAMVCPITILDSRDLNRSPKRIMEIASSYNRSEKIKEIGCQEWKGGLEVRMSDSELAKLKQMQEEGKVGFLFFQNRPLNQGIDFLMIYTGDLTNNPTGEYGEAYIPQPLQTDKTSNNNSGGRRFTREQLEAECRMESRIQFAAVKYRFDMNNQVTDSDVEEKVFQAAIDAFDNREAINIAGIRYWAHLSASNASKASQEQMQSILNQGTEAPTQKCLKSILATNDTLKPSERYSMFLTPLIINWDKAGNVNFNAQN
jgi:hypothetical protein